MTSNIETTPLLRDLRVELTGTGQSLRLEGESNGKNSSVELLNLMDNRNVVVCDNGTGVTPSTPPPLPICSVAHHLVDGGVLSSCSLL